MSVASADIFGIQMIKPTKSGGQVWYQYNADFNDDPQVYTYSATNEYSLHNVVDADGTRFTISNSADFETYISPTTGLNPAACITDQQEMARRGYMQHAQDWKNVECTIQLVIFTESADFITLGFRGGRHQGSGAPQGCTGCSYLVDISMAQGGLIRVRKESWNVSVHNWLSVLASGFDSGKVCGFTFKVLVYNTEDVKGVNVEVYVATSNDNHFVKVLSGLDSGQINTDATVCNCTAQGQPLIWGAPAIMLKGTSGQFGFKNWSIREIQGYGTNLPPAPPPTGGGDPGTGGGGTNPPPGGGGGTGGGETVDLTPILATPATSYVVSGGGPNVSPLDIHFIFAGAAWNNTTTTTPGQTTTTYTEPTIANPPVRHTTYFNNPSGLERLTFSNAIVHFIFWGAGWNSQTTPYGKSQITTFVQKLLASNHFDKLIQYGIHRPKLGSIVVNTTYAPVNNFSETNLVLLLKDTIQTRKMVPDQPVPESYPIGTTFASLPHHIYFVLGPPGCHPATDFEDAVAFHYYWYSEDANGMYVYCYTDDRYDQGSDFAKQTYPMSHEIIECITEPLPDGGGIHTDFTDPETGQKWEVCDYCYVTPAQPYTSTVEGYTVANYWSDEDNVCVGGTAAKPSWLSCPSNGTYTVATQNCAVTSTTPGTDTASVSLKTKIQNSITAVFSSSYFKGLLQYGYTKAPVAKSFTVNTTTAIPNNYTASNISALVADSINKGAVPANTSASNKNAYVVILPPNVKATGSLSGWRFSNKVSDYYNSYVSICPTGSASSSADYDTFTRALTTFLVNTVTNLSGVDYKGYSIKLGTPLDSKVSQYGKEVGSVCADEFATVAGVSVAKYWSDQAGKCDVPPATGNPTPWISCHTGALWDSATNACVKQTTGGGGGTTPGQQQGYAIVEAAASDNDGNVPANAIDGKLDTRWSAFGKGNYLKLDLGTAKPVNKVKIAWYQGDKRTNNYEIKTAETQGGSYTSQKTGTSVKGSNELQDYAIDPDNPVRYIRIYVYGNSLNDWCSISEVQIWGPGTTTGGDPGTGTGGDPGSGGQEPGGDTGGGTNTLPPPTIASWNFFDTSFSVDYNKIGLCNPSE